MPLSIGLDTCPVFGDAMGGIPTFVRQLAANLLWIDAENSYFQCYKISRIKRYSTLHPRAPNFKRIWYDRRFVFPLRNLDLFHGTAEWLPLRFKKARLMTVHDMRGIRSKHDFDPCCADQYCALSDPAVRIVTDTRFIKHQMLERLPEVKEERITVVPLACDPFFKPPENSVRKDQILFVGQIVPSKNILGLVSAFNRVRAAFKETRLVLCGPVRSREYYREILEFVESKPGLRERVEWRHTADNEALRALYCESRLCVLPSFYEGFGLPVLEAQSCGCPMICSAIGPLMEIAGDSALYAEAQNEESLAQALEKLLQSDSACTQLIEKGFKNIGRFSWEKTARTYRALYTEIAAAGPR